MCWILAIIALFGNLFCPRNGRWQMPKLQKCASAAARGAAAGAGAGAFGRGSRGVTRFHASGPSHRMASLRNTRANPTSHIACCARSQDSRHVSVCVAPPVSPPRRAPVRDAPRPLPGRGCSGAGVVALWRSPHRRSPHAARPRHITHPVVPAPQPSLVSHTRRCVQGIASGRSSRRASTDHTRQDTTRGAWGSPRPHTDRHAHAASPHATMPVCAHPIPHQSCKASQILPLLIRRPRGFSRARGHRSVPPRPSP